MRTVVELREYWLVRLLVLHFIRCAKVTRRAEIFRKMTHIVGQKCHIDIPPDMVSDALTDLSETLLRELQVEGSSVPQFLLLEGGLRELDSDMMQVHAFLEATQAIQQMFPEASRVE